MAGVIHNMYMPLPPPADRERADAGIDELAQRAPALGALAGEDRRVRNLLRAVFGASPFLSRIILNDPEFATRCFKDPPEELLTPLLNETGKLARCTAELAKRSFSEGDAEIMGRLRQIRRRVALLAALADLADAWTLEEIMVALTRFADAATSAALRHALQNHVQTGVLEKADAEHCGIAILAMGKMGAEELNYSSDIDLIVLFDAERMPLRRGADAQTVAVRIVRQMVRILSEITADGYVFRTDLRLRPDPGSTQVAISVEAALTYYASLGQNWERAAMIKARAAAGDIMLGKAFLEELSPWIWRKYLDFDAIADIAALKRQIHAVKGHGQLAVAGHNIKVGRGGIREIEFFVQTQQLIAGGRNPKLRGRKTLEMLETLAEAGWITPDVAQDMERAYRYLRHVEHRLQMMQDQQTQTLPANEEALEALARFCGHGGREDFSATLLKHMESVQRHYSALFEDTGALAAADGSLVFTGAEDDAETLKTLERLGFKDPKRASAIIRGWHFGRYRAMRSQRARERLTEITPILLKALARAGDPDAGLVAFDHFLEGLPTGVQLFSLLKANPHLMDLLVTILATAPLLAEELARRPHLFDVVVDGEFLAPFPEREGYLSMLERTIPETTPFEDILDLARLFTSEQKFRIGVRLISETTSVQEASRAYTALAEAVIERMLRAVWKEMRDMFGEVAGGRAAVIAMGKLGGREMTATSDLDLIVVYDHDPEAEYSIGGKRSLSGSQWFSRLTQRLVSALSAPTPHGILYEVDMRLRPSGSQGPVATHIESFTRYHEKYAWTWEHLALTRARVIAGDERLNREIAQIVRRTLTLPREKESLFADVRDMRKRILREKTPRSVWDVKFARGGLIDIEFIIQSLQLLHAANHAEVLHQNTAEALSALQAISVLSEEDAEHLFSAWNIYQHIMHILRLCVREGFDGRNAPEGLQRLLANATETADLASAEAHLAELENAVQNIFKRRIGPLR